MGAGDDVNDLESGAVGVEVFDGGDGIFLVLEPDEGNVVRGLLIDLDLCGIHDKVGVDLFIGCWVDGGLAVLRSNDDQGLVVDVFVF